MVKRKKVSEMEQIEKNLKEQWLRKKISKEQLSTEMKDLIKVVKKDSKKFEQWKEYLRITCMLDTNVKNGEAVLISVASLIFSLLSYSMAFGNTMSQKFEVINLVCAIAILAGGVLFIFGAARPYLKKYPKERTFYELLLYYAEEDESAK